MRTATLDSSLRFYAKRFAVDSFLRASTSVTPVHKHNSHPGARLHAKKVEQP